MSNPDEKKLKQYRLIVKILGVLLALVLILAAIYLNQISTFVGNNLDPKMLPIVKYFLFAAGGFDIIFFLFIVK